MVRGGPAAAAYLERPQHKLTLGSGKTFESLEGALQMSWLTKQVRWIMLVSGALTCTMFYAAVAPEAAQISNFGSALTGPVADVVVRNWGALIGLMGLMLIYGAFNRPVQRLVLLVAATSKLVFISLVLYYGQTLLGSSVRVAVVVDAVWVVVFAVILVGTRIGHSRAPA